MAAPLVRAAGIIVFRAVENFQYLLLQASDGVHHWTPPKGHLDPGEDALTAARRETEEEAGLPPGSYEILEGSCFPFVLEYRARGKPKKVEYWVARLHDPNTSVIISHEHQAFRWADIKGAKELAKGYPDFQDLLDRVEEYLKANSKK